MILSLSPAAVTAKAPTYNEIRMILDEDWQEFTSGYVSLLVM